MYVHFYFRNPWMNIQPRDVGDKAGFSAIVETDKNDSCHRKQRHEDSKWR